MTTDKRLELEILKRISRDTIDYNNEAKVLMNNIDVGIMELMKLHRERGSVLHTEISVIYHKPFLYINPNQKEIMYHYWHWVKIKKYYDSFIEDSRKFYGEINNFKSDII